MKTPLLALSLLLGSSVFAQEIIVQENFDQLLDGNPITEQSSAWETWDGSASVDADVSSAQSFSPPNSLHIEDTNNDVVLPVGPFTTGAYRATWKMFIPTGEGGYFNALHNWSLTSTAYEWAVDVFFAPDGAISTTAAGSNQVSNYVFTHNEWFDIQLDIDLNNDLARVYFNGNLLREWQWSLINNNGNPGNNQLAAFNFYGTEGPSGANTMGWYYIDDVLVETFDGLVNIEQEENTALQVYPNPFTNQLTLQGNIVSVNVYSADGKLIETVFNNSREAHMNISTAHYAPGIYLVKLNTGNMVKTHTLMKH